MRQRGSEFVVILGKTISRPHSADINLSFAADLVSRAEANAADVAGQAIRVF